MNAPTAPAATLPDSAVALLRTLVLCDLVDSTALIERLGDQHAAEVFRRHDRLVRSLIRQHGGQEIDKTDGFLSMFERPIQAIGFALEYQRALRRFAIEEGIALSARTGIHVGDVMVWHNAASEITEGAKPVEVEGLVKPVAARLMGLALPGQILMSGVAYTIAHRSEGELGATLEKVRWCFHGRFRFKGVPEAVPVHEVGEDGVAPLKAPAWTGKAHRETPIWRRPAMLAVEALVLLALIAVPVWNLFRPQPAIAFAARDWVVLADLRNLTDESRFDQALQEAFRIGLEQSRHVNVLSDLKLRTTLERMQRPADQAIDRETGAEIAVREGARALVLPSIAEVGGRVRFTAEVIDPHTQATVYSESADGVGLDSVLPSVDAVNRSLRGRLGEAIAAVSQSSQPLEKVATADMDALRAYSLAVRAIQRNDDGNAVAFLRQAIEVDPGFALARLTLATVLQDQSGSLAEALALLEDLDDPGRLSVRDRLHLEGVRANLLQSATEAIGHWRRMTELYPDDFQAHGHLAYRAWLDANDLALAVPAADSNAVVQNPNRALGLYLRAFLALAQGDDGKAEEGFAAAAAAGLQNENQFAAFLFASRRDYDGAASALAIGKESGLASSRDGAALSRAAIAVDQGLFEQAAELLDDLPAFVPGDVQPSRHSVHLADIYLDWLRGGESKSLATGLSAAARGAVAPADALPRDRVAVARRLAAASWLAARIGNAALARSLLATVEPDLRGAGWPELDHRIALAQARLALIEDEPQQAIALLLPRLDGSELWLTRHTLAEALYAAGELDRAREQVDWLVENRGRAWAEVHGARILHLPGVAESNLILLAAAEAEQAAGQSERAQARTTEFLASWPQSRLSGPVAARLHALQASVTPPPEAD